VLSVVGTEAPPAPPARGCEHAGQPRCETQGLALTHITGATMTRSFARHGAAVPHTAAWHAR